jgi:hypothetical protein
VRLFAQLHNLTVTATAATLGGLLGGRDGDARDASADTAAAASISQLGRLDACAYEPCCCAPRDRLLLCQSCAECGVHEACCREAIAALRLDDAPAALCALCTRAVRDALSIEPTDLSRDTDLDWQRLSEVSGLRTELGRLGRGTAAAADALAGWRERLQALLRSEALEGAPDDVYAEGDALCRSLLDASVLEQLRGRSPNAHACAEALAQYRLACRGAADFEQQAQRIGDVLERSRAGGSLHELLRPYSLPPLVAALDAFVHGALADALGIGHARARAGAAAAVDDDDDDDEPAAAAGARRPEWRDRRRRLAEAVFTLASNRMIGNQKAMPNLKMLLRLISFFLKEPRRLGRFRSGLFRQGRLGPEQQYLRARAVRLRHNGVLAQRRSTADFVQSADNASFCKMATVGTASTSILQLISWTALGETFWPPAGGFDEDGEELSRRVGRFIVVSKPYANVAVPEIKPGARSSSHPTLRLPTDADEFSRLEFVAFDGTPSHAACLVPGAVNLTDAPTMLTGQSERRMLEQQLNEEVLQTIMTLGRCFGTFDDVPGLVIGSRPRSFGPIRQDGEPPGVFGLGSVSGEVAYSQAVHRPQWNADCSGLEPARLVITPPVAEDLNSLAGALAVALFEAQRHGQLSPGWYNKVEGGDGNRVFAQGDVATDKCALSNLRRLQHRVYRACLPASHPQCLKFESVDEAKGVVRALAMLAVPDRLHAPLHNGMAYVKAILEPYWLIASLASIKVFLGCSGIRPSKEGESYRAKKRLLRTYLLAYVRVQVRRFHTTAELVDAVARTADGKLDEADYLKHFLAMVAASDADGELKVLNHLVYRLLVPFSLEERARRCGFAELMQALRKYWLPYLSESNCPNVSHSLLRQIFGYFGRSARRNGLVLHNASPSLKGTFGRSIELDALQELIVKNVKEFLSSGSSDAAQLESLLNTIGGNLDIAMELIPELERVLARKQGDGRTRSREGGLARDVKALASVMARAGFDTPDVHRTVESGKRGSLATLLHALIVPLPEPSASFMDAPLFYYIHETGGQLCVVDSALVAVHTELAAASAAGRTPCGSALVGISFGRVRADGTVHHVGNLRAVAGDGAHAGEAEGFARVPWGRPARPRVPTANARLVSAQAMAAGRLRLSEVVTDTVDKRSSMLRVGWLPGPRADAALADAVGYLRALLPADSIVVLPAGAPRSLASQTSAHYESIAAALLAGDCLVARAYSLRQAAVLAHGAAQRVRVAGVRGERTPGGAWRRSAARQKVPVAERRLVYKETTQPAAARAGGTQPLELYLYHPKTASPAPNSAGGRGDVNVPTTTGVHRQYNWDIEQTSAAAGSAAADAQRAAALDAKAAHNALYLWSAPLTVDAKKKAAAAAKSAPGPYGRPNVTDQGHATRGQLGDYESALDGDNTSLKFVRSYLAQQKKGRKYETAANDLLYELRTDPVEGGSAALWARLVSVGARPGADCGLGGGGGSGDGGSGGGGSAAAPSPELHGEQARVLASLTRARGAITALTARFIMLTSNTTNANIAHEELSGVLPDLRIQLDAARARVASLEEQLVACRARRAVDASRDGGDDAEESDSGDDDDEPEQLFAAADGGDGSDEEDETFAPSDDLSSSDYSDYTDEEEDFDEDDADAT